MDCLDRLHDGGDYVGVHAAAGVVTGIPDTGIRSSLGLVMASFPTTRFLAGLRPPMFASTLALLVLPSACHSPLRVPEFAPSPFGPEYPRLYGWTTGRWLESDGCDQALPWKSPTEELVFSAFADLASRDRRRNEPRCGILSFDPGRGAASPRPGAVDR
ncbi:MAG: hypothetical protein IPK26_04555 [Planctomycetes bacterium]|nr:hypothetical protein [Planctomycetota bacterium]